MNKKKDTRHLHFSDRVEFRSKDKTAISVRDGVLEYVGSEIGLEPADNIFTVYRSPATIGNACHSMVGIPLTDEHITLDSEPPDTGSSVLDSKLVDVRDEITDACLGVQNKLSISDAMLAILERKRQLSLGYSADLVPHDKYDFEQVNIQPHHLAVVENGRCGPLCCFLDKQHKPKKEESMKGEKKFFYDENGEISLEQVVEIATSLPEAIKKVPVSRLAELMAPLMEINSYMKEQGAMPEEENLEDEDKNKKEGLEDEDINKDKEKFEDSQKFKDATEKKAKEIADVEVRWYAQVMGKAKNFLDTDYDFGSKTANQIMRDALATQYGDQQFEDSELPTAFKLLKKLAPDYSQFGDSALPSSLEKRIEGSLKQ